VCVAVATASRARVSVAAYKGVSRHARRTFCTAGVRGESLRVRRRRDSHVSSRVSSPHGNVGNLGWSSFSSPRTKRTRQFAVDEDRASSGRARLDAIQAEENAENFVEDPGEFGTVDLFSGLNVTKDALTFWEATHAFFYPRVLLFAMTTLGLAASVPQSLGGLARGDVDGVSVLATNVVFLTLAAAVTASDLSRRKKDLARIQRELALGEMVVIQRDKFRNERTFPLASLRQAARVAIVYGDAEKGKYFPSTFRLPDRPDYTNCLLIHITRD